MKKKDNTNKYLWLLCGVSIFIISGILYYYHSIFKSFKIDANVEHFALFGDFIGGTLNPILAFLGFIALLYTIKLQSNELRATREELEKSAKAQEEQSISLQLQNISTKLQSFESTFFQLLNQHNQYLDVMLLDNKVTYVEYGVNKIGREYIKGPLERDQLFKNFEKLNNEKRSIKNYFMTLYQILKFIDNSHKEQAIDAKFYTNILRALIDDEVLRTLALNCISFPHFIEYKRYLEKYEFFEHIYIESVDSKSETILDVLGDFESNAFGQNIGLIKLINKRKNK